MTDYNDKAQRIVKLGVGRGPKDTFRPDMYDLGAFTPRVDAKTFCNDWRVVGALMEKVHERGMIGSMPNTDGVVMIFSENDVYEAHNDSLREAIVDACLEALANDTNP